MEQLSTFVTSTNILWALVAAALVFFMQAGFAMVETGFTRSKNAGNIIMKNVMDFACGTPAYWLLGFGLMFGGSGAIIGGIDLFTGAAQLADGSYDYTTLIFQTVFCATAATIVSGSMAERTKFSAYLVYSICISALVYPISGHWIWGGGWLSQLGFHDFAGSTAVHMVGGVSAFIGAKVLGPRLGKYGRDGKAKAIPGHSITLGALGCFILWFCWFGFNGGSTVAMVGESGGVFNSIPAFLASKVFVTTNLAACTASITAMLFTWCKYGKPDVSMTLNGSLAGLVAITAGADIVNPWAAAVIGVIAGVVIVLSIDFIDRKVRVDDPVGAVSVHGVCGALGTILTGVFVSNADLAALEMSRAHFLGTQFIGVISVIAWVAVTMTIIFQIIKRTIGLRVSTEDEVLGLDISEHGLVSSYAGFLMAPEAIEHSSVNDDADYSAVPLDISSAVEVIHRNHPMPDSATVFTKVDIITRPSKLEELKLAMNSLGISGMTVTNVMGYGMQKGQQTHYRGVEVDVTFLPKVKLEIVVCKVPVAAVVDIAKKVLYTGKVGDGKIFIHDVLNVVKVRTGEEGFAALQDIE
ncbi:MAG: ammonium transporter [Oscillospiraceae bacterium]|nr:ammonium transporter [Oscillospiraceae bacterium]